MISVVRAGLAVAVAGMAAAGCGGGGDAGTSQEVSESAALSWGEQHRGVIGLSVTTPEEFTTSEHGASPSGEQAWRTVIAVTNHGDHPWSLTWLQVGAMSGESSQLEVIDPRHGCNGLAASPPVMPGETAGVVGCWTGSSEPRRLILTRLDATETVTFGD